MTSENFDTTTGDKFWDRELSVQPNLQIKARAIVSKYINQVLSPPIDQQLIPSDVIVVWFCKTLENWKSVLVSNKMPETIFEVSYSGAKHETYVDVYAKFENICVPD